MAFKQLCKYCKIILKRMINLLYLSNIFYFVKLIIIYLTLVYNKINLLHVARNSLSLQNYSRAE